MWRWDDKERDLVWCVREECGRGTIHCYSTITTRLGLGIAPRNDIKSGGGAWEADIFPSASKN